MPTFDAEEFLNSVNQKSTPEEVEAAFEKVHLLPAAERKVAADALQREIVRAFETYKDTIKRNGLEAVKKQLEEDPVIVNAAGKRVYGDEAVEQALKGYMIFLNVWDLQDNADPLLKTFARATMGMTHEDLNSTACLTKPMSAVVDAVAESMKQTPTSATPRNNTPRPK